MKMGLFSLESFARVFIVVFCGWTAVTLLFFFDASIGQFSPDGIPPKWLLEGGGVNSVRLASQLYASLLVFFAVNNLLRLLNVRQAYPSFGVSLVFVVRALHNLSMEGPVLVDPKLFQSLMVMTGGLLLANFIAQPLVLNVASTVLFASFRQNAVEKKCGWFLVSDCSPRTKAC
jgi:hypothetical protein